MNADIDRLMDEMTLEEKVGQMIYAGVLEDEIHWPNEETKKIITECTVGAVRVYGSRCEPYFCAEFVNQLQKWAKCTRLEIPLLVGADLEFGASAIASSGATTFPQQMALGAANSVELAEQVSRVIARESLAMGINMNHRPVADVNINPQNSAVGARSYGADTDQVSRLVQAAIRGARQEGLLTLVKHYPGHGDANADSHLYLPTTGADEDTFRRIHLKPFEQAVRAGVDGVMTAHLLVEALDSEYPATLSYRIITEILRNELGFEGLVATDSMNMRGITSRFKSREATIKAVQAGDDLILSIGSFDAQLNRRNWIVEAVKEGTLSEKRIDASLRRILRAKKQVGLFEQPMVEPLTALKICGNEAHLTVAKNVSLKGTTILKHVAGALPIPKKSTVLVTGFKEIGTLGSELSKRIKRVIMYDLPSGNIQRLGSIPWDEIDAVMEKLDQYKRSTEEWCPSPDEMGIAVQLANMCDVVVMTSFGYTKNMFPGQKKLLTEIKKTGSRVIVVSFGLPNSVEDLTECSAYLATYVQNELSLPISEAIVDVLLGEAKACGKLPLQL